MAPTRGARGGSARSRHCPFADGFAVGGFADGFAVGGFAVGFDSVGGTWHGRAMTWTLIKLGIRLVAFLLVFWVATRRNPKIVVQPKWAIPLIAGVFSLLNTGLYWLLKPVLNLASFGVAWFLMPLVLNLIFLIATMRAVQSKKWLQIEGVGATLYLAGLLTVARGLLWFGLDWMPAKF